MTRINIGVKPSELTDKHLLAEHREIVRIPNTVYSGRAKIVDIPKEFTLGTGHVKFFYNKLEFLRKRYEDLYNECLIRGFNIGYYAGAFENLPKYLMNDYKPTEKDEQLIRQRIKEKLEGTYNEK
jgi:hypothetical protein